MEPIEHNQIPSESDSTEFKALVLPPMNAATLKNSNPFIPIFNFKWADTLRRKLLPWIAGRDEMRKICKVAEQDSQSSWLLFLLWFYSSAKSGQERKWGTFLPEIFIRDFQPSFRLYSSRLCENR